MQILDRVLRKFRISEKGMRPKSSLHLYYEYSKSVLPGTNRDIGSE